MAKILLIDTDEVLLANVSETLKEAGHIAITTSNSREAIALAKREIPDLILLELNMPLQDGIDICIELCDNDKLAQTIFVFHTTAKEDYAQVSAFNAGADDYIIKPIKSRVLISRLNALLKRHRTHKEIMTRGQEKQKGLKIDRERYLVIKDGEDLFLPRKQFELLDLLLKNPIKVYSREDIASRIWGKEMDAGNRTIDVHIRHLRKMLGNEYIRTIKGVGYSFE